MAQGVLATSLKHATSGGGLERSKPTGKLTARALHIGVGWGLTPHYLTDSPTQGAS